MFFICSLKFFFIIFFDSCLECQVHVTALYILIYDCHDICQCCVQLPSWQLCLDVLQAHVARLREAQCDSTTSHEWVVLQSCLHAINVQHHLYNSLFSLSHAIPTKVIKKVFLKVNFKFTSKVFNERELLALFCFLRGERSVW